MGECALQLKCALSAQLEHKSGLTEHRSIYILLTGKRTDANSIRLLKLVQLQFETV